ncbi:MAG: CHAD domain-containing protein [Nitrospiraceae bacterium]
MPRSDNRLADALRSLTVTSTVEREIKLSVDPEFRLPHIPGTPLPRRLLISTYYDTVSHDLAHAGITLRHRVERQKKAWQLKVPLGNDRQEVEVVNGRPFPPPAFRDLLVLHLGPRKLAPVATLRVWRTGVLVRRHHAPVAEIALDSVSVVKNGCVIQRFRELEIERLGADDDPLQELEHLLRRAGARDHDGRPTVFRALSLPVAAPEAPPARDAPVVDHVKWALTQHVHWFLAHDPGTRLGAESESLHHMRVATRRLRAVLRAARPILVSEWASSLQSELTWLSHLLGPARDLDVQIAYFSEEAAGSDARDRKPLAQFVTHLQAQRARVQQVVLSELKSARYLDVVRRLQQAAQNPSIMESPVTLYEIAKREFKKLRKAIRRLGSSPSHAKLHEVRIKTKRARYAAELAVWSVGKPASRFMKQAMAVQDLLGVYQDALQAETHIRTFLKQSTSVRAGFVAGRLVERQRQRRETVRKTMKPPLKRLLRRGKSAWN